ncbi:MAG: hypothetical protein JWM36_2452 [Hyphomicrobiales bacterium]|nr:hypothetical protein [Hyphomicrobiales bacterium]
MTPLDRGEVITVASGRRRWSADEKARVVEETLQPDAVVSEIARHHGLMPMSMRPKPQGRAADRASSELPGGAAGRRLRRLSAAGQKGQRPTRVHLDAFRRRFPALVVGEPTPIASEALERTAVFSQSKRKSAAAQMNAAVLLEKARPLLAAQGSSTRPSIITRDGKRAPSARATRDRGDENAGARVKQALEKRVELQVIEPVGRMARAGHHLVPLQDRMENGSGDRRASGQQDALRRLESAACDDCVASPSSLAMLLHAK